MDWRTVAVFNTPKEANLAGNLLESYEIPCFIKSEHMGGLYFNIIGGVELQVPAMHFEKALQILESTDLA